MSILHDIHGDHVYLGHYPAAAATVSTAAVVFVAPFTCEVQTVKLAPEAGVTGDDTNYCTLTLFSRGTDGTGTTSLKATAFKTGTDLTAVTQNAFLATATNAAENEVYELVKSHAGAGLAIPNTTVVTRVRGR